MSHVAEHYGWSDANGEYFSILSLYQLNWKIF